MTTCRIRMRRAPRGGRFASLTIPVPHQPGTITVSGWGSSLAGALKKAASVAKRISEDPVMSALIPPQAKAAIVAAKTLSKAAAKGKPALNAALKQFSGPGKARLAKVLGAKTKPKAKTRVRAASKARARAFTPSKAAPFVPSLAPAAPADNSYDDGVDEYVDEVVDSYADEGVDDYADEYVDEYAEDGDGDIDGAW